MKKHFLCVFVVFSFYAISSVTQSCPILSNPMDWSMLGFTVYHQLSEPISNVSLLFFPFMLSVHSVVSDSKQPHGLQHARLRCLSPTLRAYSNSYQVSDAIQPSHLLSFPSPHAFNLSQHQGLFQRVNSLHQVAIPLFLWLHLQYRF